MTNKTPAVVFYARDFLSVEFARMGSRCTEYQRVYIVVSDVEKANVLANDEQGVVFQIAGWSRQAQEVTATTAGALFNNDRYLRNYAAGEIQAIVLKLESLCGAILDQFDVRFYLDEPVSGFPNLLFNARFTGHGAICLHFQTSWLPGYMYFSSDPAHAVIPALNLVTNGAQLIHDHIESRKSGGALPLYVLSYGALHARLKDAGLTLIKGVYRKLFRSGEYYLDRDPSAHFIHARALLASTRGGYASESQLRSLDGKYVLYPLHYEPEAVLNYFSPFSRQEEIAEQILDALPLGYELLLKEHPSQPGALNMKRWRTVTRYRRVIKVRGDVNARSLIGSDLAVVSIGSTLAVEAALAGRPVGVLGDVHFATMPGIRLMQSPRDLAAVLTAPRASREQIEKWYGDFLNLHCFEGNIMKGRTTAIDLPAMLARVRRGVRHTP